jgi:hypothetical protein
MRDYQLDELPYKPIVRIEPITHERSVRVMAKAIELLLAQGYRRDDPNYVKHHLLGDASKPPRVVALLIATQAIKELELAGHPPTRENKHISAWVLTLPDDVAIALLRECVERTN